MGHIEGPSIHNILSRIEFLSATNLKDQLEYIKKVCPELTVCVVVKLLGISLDDERSNISPDDVERYIHDVEEMMENLPYTFLLINFDETGFWNK